MGTLSFVRYVTERKSTISINFQSLKIIIDIWKHFSEIGYIHSRVRLYESEINSKKTHAVGSTFSKSQLHVFFFH